MSKPISTDDGGVTVDDLSDSPPGNPTDAYSERDYNLRLNQSKIKVLYPRKGTPDLQQEKKNKLKRDGFGAVVIKKLGLRQYTVLRQDGLQLTAEAVTDTSGLFEDYRIGQEVTLEEGQKPNTWIIVARLHQNEMYSFQVTSSIPTTTGGGGGLIIMDTATLTTGFNAFTIVGGGLRADLNIRGVYEISVIAEVKMISQVVPDTVFIIYFTVTQDRIEGSPTISGAFKGMFTGAQPQMPAFNGQVHDVEMLYPHALTGGIGLAIYDYTQSVYKCLMSQQQALTALATCGETGGLSGAAQSVRIRGMFATSPSPFNLLPNPIPTTAFNAFRHRGQDGDHIQLLFNGGDLTNDAYDIIDIMKHDLKEYSDVRISSDGQALEFREATVAMEYSQSPPVYQRKILLEQCGAYNG